MKYRWGASVRSIIMRLRDLGFLGRAEVTLLYKRIAVRWGSRGEPSDGREPERPRLLRRTIGMLAENNVMPLSAVGRFTGLSEADVESLAGLPTGHLGSHPQNVIQFVRMR
jgi:hypothetical protein